MITGARAPPEEGQVSLEPLTIFFPDVTFDTFWFMHDLVDVLGVESLVDGEITESK